MHTAQHLVHKYLTGDLAHGRTTINPRPGHSSCHHRDMMSPGRRVVSP